MKLNHLLFALLIFLLPRVPSFAADPYAGLPEKADPKRVGALIVDNYLSRPILTNRSGIIYPEVCAWYGALTYSDLALDDERKEKLIRRFDPVLKLPLDDTQTVMDAQQQAPPVKPLKAGEVAPTNFPLRIAPNPHVDFRVFGVVPFELYILTHKPEYLELGRKLADAQWKKTTSDGITAEARYWVDDMYMIPVLQMQAYRATHNEIYLTRAALTACAYLDKLQQPNGLFMHAADSPFYWGRGNGWFAVGMAEILRDLPKENPSYPRIMVGYKKMMQALLKYQADVGLWRQLIDVSDSWTETSGSAMFTFAIVTGVKNHWLDSTTYGPASRKAWIALVNALDAKSNLVGVCVGTNKGMMMVGPNLRKQEAYYLARDRKGGDLHGQAPMLWVVSALLR
jgi:hypothetical protein